MKQGKKYLIGILVLIGVAFITGLYAKNDFSIEDRKPINISEAEKVREISKLLPQVEKEDFIEQELKKDLRPLNKEPVKVKGLYMSGQAFNSSQLFSSLVNLVEETELNALVIDLKDDHGALTTDLDVQLAQDLKIRTYKGRDAAKNMNILRSKNIYPIARIVVFKDPALAENKPELALRRQDGTVWRDRKQLAWVDPHHPEVWEYTVDIAKEAAKMGFREIQFDYVRFPSDGNMRDVVYPYADGRKKEDVIHEFLQFAKKELEPYNVFLAADVFGLTTMTSDDMGIGQKIEKIITEVDYICPMVYPSHYGSGNYGFTNPNAHPYEIVQKALLDGLEKIGDVPVVIRPWLQDFDLGKPAYGSAEVRAQIKAIYDAGLEEWLLWNARNKYTESALLSN